MRWHCKRARCATNGHKLRAKLAKQKTRFWQFPFDMKFWRGQKNCWNQKSEAGMQRVWKCRLARKVSWKTCRGQGSSVRFTALGAMWNGRGTTRSHQTTPVWISKRHVPTLSRVRWSFVQKKCWRDWAERHEHSELKTGSWAGPT